MGNAGRETSVPERHDLPVDAEAIAATYLELADGNPSLALRLAAADAFAEHQRVAQLEALASRGFARWGRRHGQR